MELCRDGVITDEELAAFSDNLRGAVRSVLSLITDDTEEAIDCGEKTGISPASAPD